MSSPDEALPPAAGSEQAPAPGEVRRGSKSGAAGDVLWDLLFHW